MKKNYYIFKNNKLGNFLEPFFTPYENEDIIEMISRGCKDGEIKNFEELSLYKIFTMDDKNGTIEYDLNFLIDLSTFKDYTKKEDNKA